MWPSCHLRGALDQLKSKVPQSGQVFIWRGEGILWTNSNPKSQPSLTIFIGGGGLWTPHLSNTWVGTLKEFWTQNSLSLAYSCITDCRSHIICVETNKLEHTRQRGGPCLGVGGPVQGTPPPPPWTGWQSDTTEKFTFPQLRWRAVNIWNGFCVGLFVVVTGVLLVDHGHVWWLFMFILRPIFFFSFWLCKSIDFKWYLEYHLPLDNCDIWQCSTDINQSRLWQITHAKIVRFNWYSL